MTRYAIVTNARDSKEIEAYLPDNYKIMRHTLTYTPDDRCRAGIEGEDVAGWTLEDYVIPRYASGGLFCHPCKDEEGAYSGTVGVMN